MIRQVTLAVGLLLFAHSAVADNCVTGIIMDGVRPDGHRAVGYVVTIDTYTSVTACNDAMSYKAKMLPHAQAAQDLIANRTDSLTFACRLPSDCSTDDKGKVEPYSRVVYLHD